MAKAATQDPNETSQLTRRRQDLLNLLSLDNMRKEQALDKTVRKIMKKLPPRYYIEDGLLFRKTIRVDPMLGLPGRIYVPTSLTPFVLIYYHLDSHAGAARLETQVSLKYFWKGLRQDCQQLTAGCHLCQIFNYDTRGKIKLAEAHIPMIRNYHWSIDVLTVRQGLDLLVAVEHFSRYKVAIVMKQKSGAYLANLLEQHIFSIFGPPKSISSDNGRNLIRSKAMRQLLYDWGIQPSTTNPYAPQTHGQVERANLSIVVLLRKLLAQTQLPVERLLPRVVHTLNSQPLPSLNNLSPIYVMIGQHPEEICPIKEDHLTDPTMVAADWKRINRITRRYVEKYNRIYERNKQKIHHRILKTPKGSYVYVKRLGPNPPTKMAPRYLSDPYQVIKEYDTTVYARNFAGQVRQYHKNNVKPCPERTAHLFEKLPIAMKAIVGDAFTYEQFQTLAEARSYPEFYVAFKRRLESTKNKVLTRQQARQLLPRIDDDRVEAQPVDIDDFPLYEDENDDTKAGRHVTFDLPSSDDDEDRASLASTALDLNLQDDDTLEDDD